MILHSGSVIIISLYFMKQKSTVGVLKNMKKLYFIKLLLVFEFTNLLDI